MKISHSYTEITHICGILDVNCGKQSQICRKFAVSGKLWWAIQFSLGEQIRNEDFTYFTSKLFAHRNIYYEIWDTSDQGEHFYTFNHQEKEIKSFLGINVIIIWEYLTEICCVVSERNNQIYCYNLPIYSCSAACIVVASNDNMYFLHFIEITGKQVSWKTIVDKRSGRDSNYPLNSKASRKHQWQ
jgi:hypothetical protein